MISEPVSPVPCACATSQEAKPGKEASAERADPEHEQAGNLTLWEHEIFDKLLFINFLYSLMMDVIDHIICAATH